MSFNIVEKTEVGEGKIKDDFMTLAATCHEIIITINENNVINTFKCFFIIN